MTRFRVAIAALLVLSYSIRAEVAPTPRDVSAELRTIVVQNDVPALFVGVVNESGLVALGAAGVRRKGSPYPVSVDDKIHLGSCTKAMTATLVAALVEEGVMTWNDTVSGAFPELVRSMHSKWKSVDVTELLTHSSGAPTDLNFDGLWERLWNSRDAPKQQRLELVRGVTSRAPEAPPGTKYIYSNAGFAIAGAIAEHAAGAPYEDLMHDRLFKPLGMTSAGFGAPGTPDRVDQPRGHTEDGDAVEPGHDADNPAAIAPAGTVHCSMADWAKFVKLHLDAAMGHPRLLKAETFATLHSAVNNFQPQYAMGWAVVNRDWAGGEVLTHNGSNTMWFCVVWVAPRMGFAVMVACNQGGKKVQKVVDDAAGTLIRELSGRAK
ncbi:MAG: beta-lactamase family protein [Candidatus Hydrogenedentes bacterium]|nr:beta-lactamase family protein [Candidatus Hydrogenedentota bacterium]